MTTRDKAIEGLVRAVEEMLNYYRREYRMQGHPERAMRKRARRALAAYRESEGTARLSDLRCLSCGYYAAQVDCGRCGGRCVPGTEWTAAPEKPAEVPAQRTTTMRVTYSEPVRGTPSKVEVPVCGTCGGTRYGGGYPDLNLEWIPCPSCNGTGRANQQGRMTMEAIEITVNGTTFAVPPGVVTYGQVVSMANGTSAPGVLYTVTYHGKNILAGSLGPGGVVEARSGMHFTAAVTGAA